MTDSTGPSPGLYPWGHHRIVGEDPLIARIGALSVAVQVRGDEIWVSHDGGASSEVPPPHPVDPPEWSRWAAAGIPEGIEILPVLPDRPLVLQPEKPFHLLPGARARIYVRVPVWVQLRIPGQRGIPLRELPALILSDTWWGNFTEGELCYWLHIGARRTAPPEIFAPDRIICPVELTNQAREDLPVEKILLRCEHLTVFRGSHSLWSDEVLVRYRGEEVGSVLEMSGKAPPEAAQATSLAPPRTPPARSLTARTFARIRGFPGLGMVT